MSNHYSVIPHLRELFDCPSYTCAYSKPYFLSAHACHAHKQLACCLLDTATCRESAGPSSSLLLFGHSLWCAACLRMTLHYVPFSCLELFPSTDAFSRVTSLCDVTLSTEPSDRRHYPRVSSFELLSSLSVNLNTPLPVAPCIPECPIPELLVTPDSTLRECNSFIKISTGLRTTASENSEF